LHFWQLVSYVSAGQAEQDEAPEDEIEPDAHGVQAEPSLLNVPGEHD
jgi:hypothetical protein